MKTEGNQKTADTLLQQLRESREKVNYEIKDMTFEQLQEYLKTKKHSTQSGIKSNSRLNRKANTNIIGNGVATIVIAKSENEFDGIKHQKAFSGVVSEEEALILK